MPLTDKQGNQFLTAQEAWDKLGVSRSTFEKWADKAGIQKFKRKSDRRVYYKAEDVESLRPSDNEFFPIEGEKELAAAR